ncbi:MAG: hypothetical protein EOO04_26110 [Chitinophagaceae bacterium]|nr:MAG: hypothetical protein EOO04_26110 [Chitinophagaceae bacterium]
MRYTARTLKTALPLYRGPVSPKQKSRKSLSDHNPDEKEFYARRITELEQELQELNILDHSLRIIEICNQIRKLRSEISRFEN